MKTVRKFQLVNVLKQYIDGLENHDLAEVSRLLLGIECEYIGKEERQGFRGNHLFNVNAENPLFLGEDKPQ